MIHSIYSLPPLWWGSLIITEVYNRKNCESKTLFNKEILTKLTIILDKKKDKPRNGLLIIEKKLLAIRWDVDGGNGLNR